MDVYRFDDAGLRSANDVAVQFNLDLFQFGAGDLKLGLRVVQLRPCLFQILHLASWDTPIGKKLCRHLAFPLGFLKLNLYQPTSGLGHSELRLGGAKFLLDLARVDSDKLLACFHTIARADENLLHKPDPLRYEID